MALSGDVNANGIDEGPLDNGWGGLVNPMTDASGIQLSVGDLVRAVNPTPGQNSLPNTPEIAGVVIAIAGNLCSVNVPKNSPIGGSVIVFNIAANQVYQLYSANPGNQEHTTMP